MTHYAITRMQRLLVTQLQQEGLQPVPEHRFHPTRKWRIDVALPSESLAIEIDGGTWSGGRHVRGAGFVKDMEKHNALTELGWRLLRYTPAQVGDGAALAQILRCL